MRRFALVLILVVGSLIAGCGPQPQPTTTPSPSEGSSDDPRGQARARLTAIGRAMFGGEFGISDPPAASATLGGNGLSWRVQILPHFGKEGRELYAKFHPYEPWDSPHNKTLIDQMPEVYASPGKPADKGMTHIRGFVGPVAFFKSKPAQGADMSIDYRVTPFTPGTPPPVWKGPKVPTTIGRSLGDISDGTSNTFMVVEAAEPVIWTKPDELKYDGDGKTKAPLPKMGGVFAGGFHAVLADGRVIWVADTTPDDTIRAAITVSGGEVVKWPWETPSGK